MSNREQENQGDWAREVPEQHFHSPYDDYGWEPGQSLLPEFRDPGFHFTPEERQRLDRWQRFQAGQGPYSGWGPRCYVRSDERILEDVCERMTRHGQLDARNIEVEVKNGEVYLAGAVSSRMAKRLAEDISDSVSGVQDVHNGLQIRTPERWVDRVGGSGVYPASAANRAPGDSQAQGMTSWGQGERGAHGYDDHGDFRNPP